MVNGATPLYVVKALAAVRENGSVNMLNREGVEALVGDTRAQEWLFKATDSQYMDALNDMGAYVSGDMIDESDFPGVEIDPISGLPEHLFRNDSDEGEDISGLFCLDCGFRYDEHQADGSCPTDEYEF